MLMLDASLIVRISWAPLDGFVPTTRVLIFSGVLLLYWRSVTVNQLWWMASVRSWRRTQPLAEGPGV